MITYATTPVLQDAFMAEFNSKIVTLLTWLNNPLGKIQPVTATIEGRRVTTPRMFVAGREYNIEVYPNDSLTNFSWFDFGKYEINNKIRQATTKVPASFNMFIDLTKVYPLVTQSRDLENVKAEVLAALKSITLISGAFKIISMSEAYEDVYKGYSLAAIHNKYFMQPFGGLNFELEIWLNNQITCTDD